MKVVHEEGIEFSLLLTEEERWEYVEQKSGIELFNSIMGLITKIRTYDLVIIIASDKRIKVIEALLDKEVIPVEIGKSPLQEDKYVDPEMVRSIIREVKQDN
jgi:soluble P-type ATPase